MCCYIEKYHDLGCEIYIVTATDPQNVSNKAAWLQEQLPFLNMYDSLIIIKNKQMLSGDIDILIDDCVDNLVGGYYHKILFDYPWNRHGFESYESSIHMLHQNIVVRIGTILTRQLILLWKLMWVQK